MNYEPKLGSDLQPAVPDIDGETRIRTRRRIFMAVGAGVLLILFIILWSTLSHTDLGETNGDKGAETPNVTVMTARLDTVGRNASGTGSIAAKRDMPVSVVGEGGRVVSVLVEPGDWVRSGQRLAVIERSVQTQQTAALAAQVEVARANAKLAESNLTRAQALVGNGFISKADLDTKVANRDSALAQLNVAVAQVKQSRESMARLDVRAPADGLVLTRSVEPGQVVSATSGTLFRIAMKGEMEMKLALNESEVAGVRIGDSAAVTPVGATTAVKGSVWQVAPVVDPQTRQGQVRILLPYDKSLRPGAFAHASVATGHAAGVLLPESAVQSDDKGNFVYIVGSDSRVTRRPVETGPVTDAGVAVVKGLSGGEAVVTTAGGFLTVGDKVKPVRAGSH